MGISSDFNREYLGDRSGQSMSVQWGAGLTRATGGVVSKRYATHVVHASMVGLVALKATKKISWASMIAGGVTVGTLLWHLGKQRPTDEGW